MTEESDIYLKNCITGNLVKASLTNRVSIKEIEVLEIQEWKPVINQCLETLEIQGVPKEKWPQHSSWSWRTKLKKHHREIAFRFYAIHCENKIQGLMLINTLFRESKIQKGEKVLYVEYIETAPWNVAGIVDQPQFSLVGSIFIATAISESIGDELEGRIALHSLPQSDGFYKKCGMTDLDIDPKNNLRYFEIEAIPKKWA